MKKIIKSAVLIALAVLMLVCSACTVELKQAESKVPAVEKLEPQPEVSGKELEDYTVSHAFSSDMVLQRDKIIQVYGTSKNIGRYVYGKLGDEERYAKVEKDGSWIIQFSPREASSEPITLSVGPKEGERTEFTGILIGDVWIVSGQSNAEYLFGVDYRGCAAMTKYYDKLTGLINENDNIRLYRQRGDDMTSHGIPTYMGEHEDVLSEEYIWTKTTQETVDDFSALGYTFVKHLADNSDVPQGIIMAAWGGCKIQDFMDPSAAAKIGGDKPSAAQMPETQAIYKYMLAPFKHMALQGVIFYQGESDAGWPEEYKDMLVAMVEGWREAFDSYLYFINVQLSSHVTAEVDFCKTAFAKLPEVRAAQTDAYFAIPDSFIVTSMDVGYNYRTDEFHSEDNLWGSRNDTLPEEEQEWEDPAHYLNKWKIGFRAAEQILASDLYKADGFDANKVNCPVPSKIDFQSKKAIVDFSFVGDGLKTVGDSDEVLGFFVVSKDGIKAKTKAKIIDKDTIEVEIGEGMMYDGIGYGLDHGGLADSANVTNSEGNALVAFSNLK